MSQEQKFTRVEMNDGRIVVRFPTKRMKCHHVNQYQVPSGTENALRMVRVVRAPPARSEGDNTHKILFGACLGIKPHDK